MLVEYLLGTDDISVVTHPCESHIHMYNERHLSITTTKNSRICTPEKLLLQNLLINSTVVGVVNGLDRGIVTATLAGHLPHTRRQGMAFPRS